MTLFFIETGIYLLQKKKKTQVKNTVQEKEKFKKISVYDIQYGRVFSMSAEGLVGTW